MGLIYKEKEDIKYSVEISQKDSKVNLLFSCDGGKFGTDEILDQFSFKVYDLLRVLQKSEDYNE